ncbi:MAG: hypothetical protein ACYS0E_18510 [Planctomycetota bacterium]
MGEALGWALGTFVLTVVAFAIAALVRRFTNARDIAALPDQTDRGRYLAEVRQMRSQGSSLQECVAHLRQQGLRRGVAQGLVIDMEREEPADVENTLECSWRGYSFRYPGNWRFESVLPDFGPDPGISVEAIGSAIFFLVGLDEESSLTEVVREWEEQIRNPERTAISRWGDLHGEGTRYVGPHVKLKLPMEIVVFRPASTETPFALMEMHALEEADLVKPGFELIRNSFESPTS